MGLIFLRVLVFVAVLLGAYFAIRRLRPGVGPAPGRPSAAGGGGDPYSILGLDRGATVEEIKAAYKKALAQYHPDKVAELGPDLRKLATIRTQEIIEAYERLLRERGA